MPYRRIARLVRWLGEQADTVLALLLGAVCSVLGITGAVQPPILASATLGTLTVIAFALLRDRSERDKLQTRLNQLLTNFDGPDLDLSFTSVLDETTVLLEAEQEIWTNQETGAYIIETQKAAFVSFLRKGGILRIVVTSTREDIKRQLAFRNHDFPYVAIENRTQTFLHYIESIINNVGINAEKLQIRYCPYVIDTSKIIVDPENPLLRKRRAVVRYPGFRNAFEERIGIMVRGEKSPFVFSHFFQEAQRLFEYAYKVVIIIDFIHFSQPAMIIELIEKLSDEDGRYLFSMTFRTVLKGNQPIEIEVVTSSSPQPVNLITYHAGSRYEIDTKVWKTIIGELLDAYGEKKVIILDGVGLPQLHDPDFWSIIEMILRDQNISLFMRVALEQRDIPHLEKLKCHHRSTVLYTSIKEDTRKNIAKLLEREVKTSLFLAKLMK